MVISAFYVSSLDTAGGVLLTIFFMFLFLESFIGGVKAKADEEISSTIRTVHYKVAPLSSGYMATSIIGILASFMFVYPVFSEAWGTAFGVVFIIMLISSVISMTNAPVAGQLETEIHMDALDVGKKVHRRK